MQRMTCIRVRYQELGIGSGEDTPQKIREELKITLGMARWESCLCHCRLARCSNDLFQKFTEVEAAYYRQQTKGQKKAKRSSPVKGDAKKNKRAKAPKLAKTKPYPVSLFTDMVTNLDEQTAIDMLQDVSFSFILMSMFYQRSICLGFGMQNKAC